MHFVTFVNFENEGTGKLRLNKAAVFLSSVAFWKNKHHFCQEQTRLENGVLC